MRLKFPLVHHDFLRSFVLCPLIFIRNRLHKFLRRWNLDSREIPHYSTCGSRLNCRNSPRKPSSYASDLPYFLCVRLKISRPVPVPSSCDVRIMSHNKIREHLTHMLDLTTSNAMPIHDPCIYKLIKRALRSVQAQHGHRVSRNGVHVSVDAQSPPAKLARVPLGVWRHAPYQCSHLTVYVDAQPSAGAVRHAPNGAVWGRNPATPLAVAFEMPQRFDFVGAEVHLTKLGISCRCVFKRGRERERERSITTETQSLEHSHNVGCKE